MAAIVQAFGAARNADFTPTLRSRFRGGPLPMMGAKVRMEVRQYDGAPTLLASWEGAVAGTSWIDEEIVAADPASGEPAVRRLSIFPMIAKATLAGLPAQNQPEPGSSQTFRHEVMVIYADGKRDSVWLGDFIVGSGVVA